MKRYDLFGDRHGYVVPATRAVESYHGEYVKAEVAQVLRDTLIQTRKVICEAAVTGFNPHSGDWAERLFSNNAYIEKALDLAGENGDE